MNGTHSHDIFGQTIECPCGKTHHVTPHEVVYSPDALTRLPDVCARYCRGRRAAVLMDVRTGQAAGFQAATLLADAGWDVTELVVEDPAAGSSPVCDDTTQRSLAERVGRVDLIVPVGSGAISDLGKWLALEANLPAVTFATAASMNGYASANVAPSIDGVKTVLQARAPLAVMAAPSVLCEAPYELTAAGLGDVLAGSVSSADWYLNHLFFGDYYCDRAVSLVSEIEPMVFRHARDLPRRDDEAIAAVFEALLLTGVAMTLAQTSAPASGGEHLVSHCLDMMSVLDRRPHDLHGRQVGVGTLLAAELYQRALAVESPQLVDPPATIDRRFWGHLADGLTEPCREKAVRMRAAREQLARGDTWDRAREHLSRRLRTPKQIRECLAGAGAACRAEHIRCDRDRLLQAFTHAHEFRARFTVLDLARIMGIMPQAAEEIVDALG